MTVYPDITFKDAGDPIIVSLQAEIEMLRGLLDNNRKGFMEMAMENFNLLAKIEKLEEKQMVKVNGEEIDTPANSAAHRAKHAKRNKERIGKAQEWLSAFALGAKDYGTALPADLKRLADILYGG